MVIFGKNYSIRFTIKTRSQTGALSAPFSNCRCIFNNFKVFVTNTPVNFQPSLPVTLCISAPHIVIVFPNESVIELVK